MFYVDKNTLIYLLVFRLLKSSDYIRHTKSLISFNSESWVVLSEIEQKIKWKIEKVGVPLKEWDVSINYGIKTGFNQAFIIDEEKKNELLEKSPKSAEIIRPILRGRDIRKFEGNFSGYYLIETHNGIKNDDVKAININDYPSIYDHLKKFSPKIEKRSDRGNHWTNLRNCAYLDQFDNKKIIYPGIMRLSKNDNYDFPRFYLDTNEKYRFTNDTYFIVGEDLPFLLALLNSNLTRFLFPFYIYSFDSNGYKVFTEYLEKIPFIRIPSKDQREFNSIVNDILEAKKKNEDSSKLEKSLNEKIYYLYGLNQEQINYIESII